MGRTIIRKILKYVLIFIIWCVLPIFLLSSYVYIDRKKTIESDRSEYISEHLEDAVQRGLEIDAKDYMAISYLYIASVLVDRSREITMRNKKDVNIAPSFEATARTRSKRKPPCRPNQLPFRSVSEFDTCETFRRGTARDRKSKCAKFFYISEKCTNFTIPQIQHRDKITWEKVKRIMGNPYYYLYDPIRCAEKGKANSAYLYTKFEIANLRLDRQKKLVTGKCLPTEEVQAYVHVIDEEGNFIAEERVTASAIVMVRAKRK